MSWFSPEIEALATAADYPQPNSNGGRCPVCEMQEEIGGYGGKATCPVYVRRQKDEAVDDAVGRGRDRYYRNAPAVGLDDEDEPDTPARTSAETVAKVQEMLGAAPEAVKEAIPEADATAAAEVAPELTKEDVTENSRNIIPVSDLLSPTGESPSFRSHCDITTDGRLQFTIEVSIAFGELATWSPMRISRFFEGIAKVVKAGE